MAHNLENFDKIDQFAIHRMASELRAQELRKGVSMLVEWVKSFDVSFLMASRKHG